MPSNSVRLMYGANSYGCVGSWMSESIYGGKEKDKTTIRVCLASAFFCLESYARVFGTTFAFAFAFASASAYGSKTSYKSWKEKKLILGAPN